MQHLCILQVHQINTREFLKKNQDNLKKNQDNEKKNPKRGANLQNGECGIDMHEGDWVRVRIGSCSSWWSWGLFLGFRCNKWRFISRKGFEGFDPYGEIEMDKWRFGQAHSSGWSSSEGQNCGWIHLSSCLIELKITRWQIRVVDERTREDFGW